MRLRYPARENQSGAARLNLRNTVRRAGCRTRYSRAMASCDREYDFLANRFGVEQIDGGLRESWIEPFRGNTAYIHLCGGAALNQAPRMVNSIADTCLCGVIWVACMASSSIFGRD